MVSYDDPESFSERMANLAWLVKFNRLAQGLKGLS